jgi:hypothetical protein
VATLRFGGDGDCVRGTGASGLSGAFTVAALVKRAAIDGAQCIFGTRAASSTGFTVELANGNRVTVFNHNVGNNSFSSSQITNTTDWYIVAITRGSGETPRMHDKNTASGSWNQGDGGTAQTTNPDACTGGQVIVGAFDIPEETLSALDPWNGDIALIAWWDGIEFSDAQIQALDDNLHVNDWLNHAAGAPSSCTPLTSTSPTDAMGLVSWTNSGATLAGGDPPGWTLDTAAAWPPADSNNDPKTIRVVRSTTRLA